MAVGLAKRELMAKRAAMEIKNGDIVNVGIGIPTLVPDYIPENVNIFLHSENGLLGIGPKPNDGEEDPNLINAGGFPCSAINGASYFDSADSFAIIRSGKLDITILGALEVDQQGNLANWIVPGKRVPGMGGGMDLAEKSRRVVVLTSHTNKNGEPKIRKKCTLPLTAHCCVNLIITELGVMEVTSDGIVLKEVFEGITVEDVLEKTDANLIVDENLKAFSC